MIGVGGGLSGDADSGVVRALPEVHAGAAGVGDSWLGGFVDGYLAGARTTA